jgi:DNA repair exonuclease SbcCD nuclease subunit
MGTQILHISDTHLGNYMYQSQLRRQDFTDAFETAIDIAIERDVDAVIHTGDLFDDPQPSLPTINDCADILRKLDNEGIPMYVIVGNHERKLDDQWVDLLRRFDLVKRLTVQPTTVGGFSLYGIDAIRKTEWEETNFDLQAPNSETTTRILCMHELVQPIVQEERGGDYHVKDILERVPFTPEGLALGDYHATIEREIDNCRVFYPGPTERTKVNETPGTVLLLETDEGSRAFSIERLYLSDFDPTIPREFKSQTVTIGESQGIEQVTKKLQELKADENTQLDNCAVVVTLKGCYNDVSSSDVYEVLEEFGVPIRNVIDKRAVSDSDIDIDVDKLENDVASLNELLEEATSEIQTHKSVSQIVEEVSDEEIAKTNIRTRTKEILTESFDGENI